MRDHGGNLDQAVARFGGAASDWIDLSTGINRQAYPLPQLPDACWTALPTRKSIEALHVVAQQAFHTRAPILALAGAQAAIQLLPYLSAPGTAKILAPTYNEHAGALRAAGWRVEDVAELESLPGADLAVIVNPNNPDGRHLTRNQVLRLAKRVGRLVVDESFADANPVHSVADRAGEDGLVVLRSFGKFYGLAGVRLGFVLGSSDEIAALSSMAGPWPVSGAAISIGCAALGDDGWATSTALRLRQDCQRLDDLARGAGWALVGGSELFRLYDTLDAEAAQNRLGRRRVWSRIFPYSKGWLRLGLPGSEGEWSRVASAIEG